MKITDLSESKDLLELQKFSKWVCKKLNIKTMPKFNFNNDLDTVEQNRTFGSTTSNGEIWVHVGDRNNADTMRTICHELVHHKQFEVGLAGQEMNDEQKQSIEDVANAVAGRLMREYGKLHVEIYS